MSETTTAQAVNPATKNVVLQLDDGQRLELPVIVGSEGERAFDITSLRDQTGYITMDPGYRNTGSCESDITFIDADQGILRYRGVPIEELAEQSNFLETAYLLIYGEMPGKGQLADFVGRVGEHAAIVPRPAPPCVVPA